MRKYKNNTKNKIITKAFTMAEAILVMTILGIIATIMITTIKPAEFKQKALKTLSKKVFSEIDNVMTQITINNTKTGQMDKLFIDNEDSHFSFGSDYSKIEQLFKKYLATTRKEYSASDELGTFKTIVTNSPTSASQSPPFYLKDGALVFLGTGEKYGVSLGATGTIDVEGCIMPKSLLGIVSVDINGEDEPNVAYQDQFHFPIGLNGVEYEQMCIDGVDDKKNKCPFPVESFGYFNGAEEYCTSNGGTLASFDQCDGSAYFCCAHPDCDFTLVIGPGFSDRPFHCGEKYNGYFPSRQVAEEECKAMYYYISDGCCRSSDCPDECIINLNEQVLE